MTTKKPVNLPPGMEWLRRPDADKIIERINAIPATGPAPWDIPDGALAAAIAGPVPSAVSPAHGQTYDDDEGQRFTLSHPEPGRADGRYWITTDGRAVDVYVVSERAGFRLVREPAATAGRESGGRLVRDVWIAWAKEQPNPKPSWLVEWDGLSEPDKEVDRRIFEACAARQMASFAAESKEESDSALRQAVDRVLRVAILAGIPEHEQDVARIVFGLKNQERVDEATRASMASMIEAKNLAQRTAEDAHHEIDRLTAERDQFAKRADFFQGEHRNALDEVRGLCDEREKSTVLIATLRELLEEREWDFEDHSCRTCGAGWRHSEPQKHKPDCALDAALRGNK